MSYTYLGDGTNDNYEYWLYMNGSKINTDEYYEIARLNNYDFYTGVDLSFLQGFINFGNRGITDESSYYSDDDGSGNYFVTIAYNVEVNGKIEQYVFAMENTNNKILYYMVDAATGGNPADWTFSSIGSSAEWNYTRATDYGAIGGAIFKKKKMIKQINLKYRKKSAI